MSSMDFRLGEWLKHVDKNAKDLKTKKHIITTSLDISEQDSATDHISRGQVVSPAIVSSVDLVGAEADRRVVNIERAGVATADHDIPCVVVDDTPIPDVEEFISIRPAVKIQPHSMPEVVIVPDSEDLLRKSEGTGEPRPIRKLEVVQNVVASAPTIQVVAPKSADELKSARVIETEDRSSVLPKQLAATEMAVLAASSLSENWERLPHHLQVLFGTRTEEVTQNSYKRFTETRSQLVERLLDPSLTLEETSRILNVCPTTVRRYTNNGSLRHQRTAGNQRRFKLSDVLSFLENSGRTMKRVGTE